MNSFNEYAINWLSQSALSVTHEAHFPKENNMKTYVLTCYHSIAFSTYTF